MFRRAKNFLADVLQQADMILLALCCAATLFGITMVYSATRYMQTNRLVIIQGCALVLGVVLYLLVSMVDLSEVVKKWKWLTNVQLRLHPPAADALRPLGAARQPAHG